MSTGHIEDVSLGHNSLASYMVSNQMSLCIRISIWYNKNFSINFHSISISMWYSKNFSINFHSISISMWHNNNFSIKFHSSALSNQMYLCISISIFVQQEFFSINCHSSALNFTVLPSTWAWISSFRWSLLYVHYNVGYGGLSCDDMRLIIDAERELH